MHPEFIILLQLELCQIWSAFPFIDNLGQLHEAGQAQSDGVVREHHVRLATQPEIHGLENGPHISPHGESIFTAVHKFMADSSFSYPVSRAIWIQMPFHIN